MLVRLAQRTDCNVVLEKRIVVQTSFFYQKTRPITSSHMQKNRTNLNPCSRLFLWLPCIGLLTLCSLAIPAQADIYRFVTIDGVETFTDAPLEKEAQIVIKDTSKINRKGSAKRLSKTTRLAPAPSLHEIIEKTIQAQSAPPDTALQEILLPVHGQITSGVGMRIDPIDGNWRNHNGIDIAVPEGTPVRSVAGGTVLYAGLRSGYGWTVLVEHNNGMITLYAHNSKITSQVGQEIQKGAVVALAGSTGRSTGPHVHFEAWQAGNNVTPAFMPGSTLKIASLPSYQRARASFRKQVLADGSLLITNLPNAIP